MALKLKDAFRDNTLRGEDLSKKEDLILTIYEIDMKKIENKELPVMSFREDKRTLILNKTNGKRIREIVGSDGDDLEKWEGVKVHLYPEWDDWSGKLCVRVRSKAMLDNIPDFKAPKSKSKGNSKGKKK